MKIEAEVVSRHLDQTLSSPLFRKAERQARFLRYVVDAALHSPEASLKEFDIGTAVYDRRQDFDPRADPIVRVEASRLRARLREHYETTPPDAIKIELPKGGYVPQFTVLESLETADGSAGTMRVADAAPPEDRSITVQSFRSLSSDVENQHFCEGLTEETLHRLTLDPNLRIIGQGALTRLQGENSAHRSRYLLESSVRHAGSDIRLTVHLIDLADGSTRLSKVYRSSIQDVFAAQESLATQIHVDVRDVLKRGGPQRPAD